MELILIPYHLEMSFGGMQWSVFRVGNFPKKISLDLREIAQANWLRRVNWNKRTRSYVRIQLPDTCVCGGGGLSPESTRMARRQRAAMTYLVESANRGRWLRSA